MDDKFKDKKLRDEDLIKVSGGGEEQTAERMRVQIRSLDQDNRNTQNGYSMMNTGDNSD